MEIEYTYTSAPSLVVSSLDFATVYTVYKRLLKVKAFLDTIAEEFIDAKAVFLAKYQDKYQVVLQY
jgi:hypothetical protein